MYILIYYKESITSFKIGIFIFVKLPTLRCVAEFHIIIIIILSSIFFQDQSLVWMAVCQQYMVDN